MPMVDIFLAAGSEEATAAAAAAAEQAAAELAAQQAAAELAAQQATQQGITQQAATSGITQGADQVAAQGANQVAGQGITSVVPGDAGGMPVNNGGGDVPTQVNQIGRGIGNNLPPSQPPVTAQPSYGLQSLEKPPVDLSSSGSLNTYNGSQLTPDVLKSEPSGLESGWNKVTEWMGKNPMTTAMGGYGLLKASGALNQPQNSFNAEPYNGPLNNYKLSPNFQTYPRGPNTNIYQPHYAATGGIMQAGGPVSQMSNDNVFGNNLNYPGVQNTGLGNANDVATHPYTGQQMASGGIVAFGSGGDTQSYSNLESNMNRYSNMLNNPASANIPYSRPDVGIFTDSNPNTRKLSAADAALYQQKTLNNRFGIHTPVNLPSGGMGRINTVPVTAKQTKSAADDTEAANGGLMRYAMGGGIGSYYPSPDDGQGGQHPQDTMMGAHPSVSMGPAYPMQGIKSSYATGGGIMQAQRYNLGGYAHGGNPRLLRGPGDGMSDNIPATIADTQPARLADGEFVVPADVVSGLGNGSTEAGAKHLHKMMDEIRMARTGTKKQGKQINPNKFVPT